MIKNYYKPTPKKWRQIGDAIATTALFIAGSAVFAENKYIAVGCIIAAAVGKFITNLFKENEEVS